MTLLRPKAFSEARENLVKELKEKGIVDKKVLNAFYNVPRHMFVPYVLRFDSYKDIALPIGKNQTISRPFTVALMTQCLNLNYSDKVLEIGTGSGFQTAILSDIVKRVYTIEIFKELQENARKIHKKLGIKNVFYKIGNGFKDWHEFAPFDKIIITAAIEKFPEELSDELNDNGIIVYPLIDGDSQILVKSEKKNDKFTHQVIDKCNFVIAQ
jgi:protein-L-isoaspartate(D-aspartate) O-methyltransferase